METDGHIKISMTVHSSIIHNGSKLETTQVSVNWWMGHGRCGPFTQWKAIWRAERLEALVYTALWVNCKDILPNERGQMYFLLPRVSNAQKRQTPAVESR